MIFTQTPVQPNNQEDSGNPKHILKSVPAHKRKKKSKSNKELAKRIVIIPVEECDKRYACGEQKTVIRHEITEKLHYQPATFEIVEERLRSGGLSERL